MTHYRIQEWPDMPGEDGGDAIVFSSEWPAGDWERHRSWSEAWYWVGGNAEPGDTVEVLPDMPGQRLDSYAEPT
jgi:hypothetical protein